MFVADYSPGVSPSMPTLVEAPVWLELRGVPPHFFNEESLERIAGLVGDPLYLHPTTLNMTNLEVAKVLTVVSLTEPLPEAVNAQFESGEVVRVGVSCPWLPPTCSFCNETRHTIRRCPTAPITCVNCKSTAHATDLCPRDKKAAGAAKSAPEKDPTDAKEKRKQKKREAKLRKRAKAAEAAKAATASQDSPRVAKDYLAEPSKANEKAISKQGSGKKKKKHQASSSESDLSPSSASETEGSEHKPESSSSDLESESDDTDAEKRDVGASEYTKVLSKKQKQRLKKHRGKRPQISHQ